MVNGHTNFLHDGRARNIQEAILWHGGEAERAKQRYVNLSKVDREAILTFLDSLLNTLFITLCFLLVAVAGNS